MTKHTDPVTGTPISTIWITSDPPGDWTGQAACRRHAERAEFFTEATTFAEADLALTICAGCPVRAPCLDYGRTLRADGVWGGTLLQRGRVRSRYRSADRPPGPERRPAAS